MTDEMEDKVHDSLLAFTDFLYAVVFGMIVGKIFEDVINATGHWGDKLGKIALVGGVFYFLAWDWLHGRLLTLKNPYRGYWRFFLEIIIACCGYGAALGAVAASLSLLLYIAVILLLGVWWSTLTIREYPQSIDLRELRFVIRYQLVGFTFLLVFSATYLAQVGTRIHPWVSIPYVLWGFLFVFIYELFIERPPGMLGGPGVPFVNREIMTAARRKIFRPKKGEE